MPTISRFYGIVINMYFNEEGAPHFHAKYGEHKIRVRIDNLTVMDGNLPPRALRLVLDWARLHQAELLREWNLARQGFSLFKIDPLD